MKIFISEECCPKILFAAWNLFAGAIMLIAPKYSGSIEG